MNRLWIGLLLVIGLIIILFFLNKRNIKEHFENDYLFPTQKVQEICNKKGLEPSYMPQLCYKADGSSNPYANCQCVDKDGMCALCYDPMVKYEMYAGKIFDPSNGEDDILENQRIKNNVSDNTFSNF
jgi:hypothetical protein